jgi:hypothetical protein
VAGRKQGHSHLLARGTCTLLAVLLRLVRRREKVHRRPRPLGILIDFKHELLVLEVVAVLRALVAGRRAERVVVLVVGERVGVDNELGAEVGVPVPWRVQYGDAVL